MRCCESHRGAPASRRLCRNGAEQVDLLATTLADSLARLEGVRCRPTDTGCSRAMRDGSSAAPRPILDERAAAGCVRRCHGDLHLGNIVLWDGRPVLFDAIEFDEAIATVDTLYDLAFLLMDLDRHDSARAANVVLNRYLWRDGR